MAGAGAAETVGLGVAEVARGVRNPHDHTVAEWYRIQLKEKVWKGLVEHSLDGWNIGTPPYGYAAERIPHPVPFKADQGRTKSLSAARRAPGH